MKGGQKPSGKVACIWSSDFAYAIGLLTADGCLSKDGRHIDFTSKDRAQVLLFRKCLDISTRVSSKRSSNGSLAYRTQFSDVLFYRFLLTIGLTPAKSKTIAVLDVPDEYFVDFFRGYFDGDGSSYSYYDPVFKKSFRFYITFTSASQKFFNWLQSKTELLFGVSGYFSYNRNNPYVQLKFSKKEAVMLSRIMYYKKNLPHLKRKRLKIEQSLGIISKRRSGEIGRHATFRS